MKAGCNRLGFVLTTALFLAPPIAWGGISEYIAAVQAEVDEFTTGEFRLAADSPWRGIVASDNAGPETLSGPAGLAEFDRFLKEAMPGTYIMYARLPTWKKEQIYRSYIDTGDIGKTRDLIYKARAPMGGR